jgi:hypothetical protein
MYEYVNVSTKVLLSANVNKGFCELDIFHDHEYVKDVDLLVLIT